MRILYLGDVIGGGGRKAALETVERLRGALSLDFVIVNGENAAHGFGITPKITKSFVDGGVDCVTTGNHAWDRREILEIIDDEVRLIRPLNYPEGTPGRGAYIYTLADGRTVMVAQVMGRLFMDPLDDPFAAINRALLNKKLGINVDAIVVDVHAEATSEKMALGQTLDGRVSLVVGTHSHIPTADTQVFPKGTGYQTDLGMCGDYDSVIGMQKEAAIDRFTRKMRGTRLEPATGDATACGVFVETDDATGLARRIEPVRVGGRLAEHIPE